MELKRCVVLLPTEPSRSLLEWTMSTPARAALAPRGEKGGGHHTAQRERVDVHRVASQERLCVRRHNETMKSGVVVTWDPRHPRGQWLRQVISTQLTRTFRHAINLPSKLSSLWR